MPTNSNSEGEDDAGEDQHLVVTARSQDITESGASEIQQWQQQRPRQGYLARGDSEKQDSHNILHDQYADGDLAVTHTKLPVLFEHGNGANG